MGQKWSSHRTTIRDGYDPVYPSLWADRLSLASKALVTSLVVGAVIVGFATEREPFAWRLVWAALALALALVVWLLVRAERKRS